MANDYFMSGKQSERL